MDQSDNETMRTKLVNFDLMAGNFTYRCNTHARGREYRIVIHRLEGNPGGSTEPGVYTWQVTDDQDLEVNSDDLDDAGTSVEDALFAAQIEIRKEEGESLEHLKLHERMRASRRASLTIRTVMEKLAGGGDADCLREGRAKS